LGEAEAFNREDQFFNHQDAVPVAKGILKEVMANLDAAIDVKAAWSKAPLASISTAFC